MRPVHIREGLGSPAPAPISAKQLFARRFQNVLERTFRISLPTLLPGIHQLSGRTAFNRYPQIFAGAVRVAPDAKRILSFGCSTGEECDTLSRYFPEATIVGADVNPLRLHKARRQFSSNDSVRFTYASDLALKFLAPFDVIFCLTVLRDSRLDAENSIGEAYPFDRFDERVALLDSLLKPGGLLVFYGNMYRFADTSVAKGYKVVPLLHTPVGMNITFAYDGKNDGKQYLDVLFIKRRTNVSLTAPLPSEAIQLSG
jgi:SAM-dependent methyltransferase